MLLKHLLISSREKESLLLTIQQDLSIRETSTRLYTEKLSCTRLQLSNWVIQPNQQHKKTSIGLMILLINKLTDFMPTYTLKILTELSTDH